MSLTENLSNGEATGKQVLPFITSGSINCCMFFLKIY